MTPGGPVSSPKCTVVVCSHNGAQQLPRLLASLRRQSVPTESFEVIVVDDGSRDGTAAVAEDAGARVVRLRPGRGLAGARNAGIDAARAQVVAFTDDDCEANPGWVEALLRRFSEPTIDAVGGRVTPGTGDSFNLRYVALRNPLLPLGAQYTSSTSWIGRLAMYLRRTIVGPTALVAGEPLYSVVGANMAFRRALLSRVGGFDPAFRFGGEEEDLCQRAATMAACIVYEPAALIVHHFKPGLTDTFRRSIAYGRGNARRALKQSDVRPIVFPLSLSVVGALLVGLCARRRSLVAISLVAPIALYPRWAVDAVRTRSPEPVVYPYVELAQEVCTMWGELEGWRAGYTLSTFSPASVDGA